MIFSENLVEKTLNIKQIVLGSVSPMLSGNYFNWTVMFLCPFLCVYLRNLYIPGKSFIQGFRYHKLP